MDCDVAILGQGPSGVMAARRIALCFPELSICMLDKSPTVRDDHSFHIHSYIEDVPGLGHSDLGEPKRFSVSIWDGKVFKNDPTIYDINQYSVKIFGQVKISNISNLSSYTVIPVSKLSLVNSVMAGVRVQKFAAEVTRISTPDKVIHSSIGPIGYRYLVSTIPLPTLLSLAGIRHDIRFRSYPFYSGHLRLDYNTHCYQALMSTSFNNELSRVVLMGASAYVESVDSHINGSDVDLLSSFLFMATKDFSPLKNLHPMIPGRIDLLPREIRKPLLHWLTERHNIFTLGRYGAWTYKVATDVWEDTKFICSLIFAKQQAHLYNERAENNG